MRGRESKSVGATQRLEPGCHSPTADTIAGRKSLTLQGSGGKSGMLRHHQIGTGARKVTENMKICKVCGKFPEENR